MVDGLIYIATVNKPAGDIDKIERVELITTFRNKGHVAVLPPSGGEHTIVVPEGEEFSIRVCVVTNDGKFEDGEEHKLTLTRDIKSLDVHKDDPGCVASVRLSQIMVDYFEELPVVAPIVNPVIPADPVVPPEPTVVEPQPEPPPAPIVNPEIPAEPTAPVDNPANPVE